MSQGLRRVLGALGVIVSLLAAFNVYGDFSAVETQARELAAPSGKQDAFLSQVSRSPLSQKYVFDVQGQANVVVTCSRQFLLLGEYSCKQE